MAFACENCGHVSDFGDFCLDCESPNMIWIGEERAEDLLDSEESDALFGNVGISENELRNG